MMIRSLRSILHAITLLNKHLCLILTAVVAISATTAYPQPPDSIAAPVALSVYNIQNLSFGAFSYGATGGSVTISPTGDRSAAGTITPLNLGFAYYQSVFEIEAPEGSVISILNGPDAVLTGSNGGSMNLTPGISSRGSTFINTSAAPSRVPINIGGKLTVGNIAANPPGTYTGTFYITFNQE